jgi:hypothetical protein
MITVKRLIKQLEQFDGDLPVMLHGYEGGVYNGPNNLHTSIVVLDVNQEWYYGPHEIMHEYMEDDCKNCEKITALIIK